MAISDTKLDIRFPRMTIQDHLDLANAPKKPGYQQWWNVPAKLVRAKQIADEELQRSIDLSKQDASFPPHNDALDAMRHSRWSRRMASEIDPATAYIVGGAHELEGRLLRNQPYSEELMDRRNNREGRRAAMESRPINPTNLQVEIGRPPAGAASSYPYGSGRGRYPER